MNKFFLGFSAITSFVLVSVAIVLLANALGVWWSIGVVFFILLCYGIGTVLEDL